MTTTRTITDLADVVPGHPVTVRWRTYMHDPWSAPFTVPGEAVHRDDDGYVFVMNLTLRTVNGAHAAHLRFVSQEVPLVQPDEPTGYGAVVTVEGDEEPWVHAVPGSSWINGINYPCSWSDLIARGPVTVRSPGWTPEVEG